MATMIQNQNIIPILIKVKEPGLMMKGLWNIHTAKGILLQG